MDAQTDKAIRRKRKPAPRRVVPGIVEERERKPLFFGWGAHLNRHERESVKERIALFGGASLILVLALLLGWGWYQDNVATPAAARAAANKPVAQVGQSVIRMGFFKRFEQFQNTQLNNQLQQIQQQVQALTGKKNSTVQLAQLQAQQSQIQQELGSLPSNALTQLLDDQAILQRSYTVGYPDTPAVQNKALKTLEQQAGGPRHLQTFIAQSGLTRDEIKMLVTADYLKGKIGPKLASKVSRNQIKVRASHILVPASKKSLAQQLYQKALAGANFAALARKYSTDPGSAKKGGDLGYFIKGQMVPQFDKAAFSMKVGQIKMVQSQYGWHIIKLTGRKMAKLTTTQYQQAQQAAYSNWVQEQQAILHVQRFVTPANLPNVASSSNSTTNPITNTNQVPQQVPNTTSGQAPRVVPRTAPLKSSKNVPKAAPAPKGSTQKKP